MDSNTKESKDSSKRLLVCPSAAALQLFLLSWVLQPAICHPKCRPTFTSTFPFHSPCLQKWQPGAEEQQWKVAAAK